MPIVSVRDLYGLGLIPFQINTHYVDQAFYVQHSGETREERITEYVEQNRTPVVGLPEGTAISYDGEYTLLGERPAILFHNEKSCVLPPGRIGGELLEASVSVT
jgi:dipeptidase E